MGSREDGEPRAGRSAVLIEEEIHHYSYVQYYVAVSMQLSSMLNAHSILLKKGGYKFWKEAELPFFWVINLFWAF